MNSVFIDANVFLDAVLQRGEYEPSGLILDYAGKNAVTAYTTAANLQNVIYFLKKAGVNTKSIINIMDSFFEYLFIAQTTEKHFLAGLHAGFTDLEDAIQYYTALNAKNMDFFITSNTKDFKKALPQLPVITPRQFITAFKLKGY
jgi:predicted nucleic acid-binding protein